jgi:hypothetical protein
MLEVVIIIIIIIKMSYLTFIAIIVMTEMNFNVIKIIVGYFRTIEVMVSNYCRIFFQVFY